MDKIWGASFLVLWLQLGCELGQQQVKQSSQPLTVQEGDISTLNCTYENSAFNYFPWYRQHPGKGPELLITIRCGSNAKEDGRLRVSLSQSAKHVSLHIKASQPGDSATYFCAASNIVLVYDVGTITHSWGIIENWPKSHPPLIQKD
uniref:Ig-like domain-containing protein n=1 Tax=Sus scrofa TaxID=9823 RepID=A0A8D1FI28_PIG